MITCQKTYFWTGVPNKDPDQPAHLHSLIRIFTGCFLDSQGCKISSCRQDCDQTAWMRMLIWDFVRRTCPKVCFPTLWLIYKLAAAWTNVNCDIKLIVIKVVGNVMFSDVCLILFCNSDLMDTYECHATSINHVKFMLICIIHSFSLINIPEKFFSLQWNKTCPIAQ